MKEALAYRWTGEAFEPVERFREAASEAFALRAVYWLSAEPDRSERTHKHQFAWLKEAWKNLPDHLADSFPTPEHLRKRALIDAGFYTETILDVGTNAAALRVRTYLAAEDPFTVAVVRGPIVVIRKAMSQSHRAMGAREFQRSKQAILEIIAGLLGVAPETLSRAA